MNCQALAALYILEKILYRLHKLFGHPRTQCNLFNPTDIDLYLYAFRSVIDISKNNSIFGVMYVGYSL